MNSHHNDSATSSIDIANVLNGIWQRKHWVIFTTLVAVAMAIVFLATTRSVYQATTQVLVENLETNFSRTDPNRSISNTIGQQEVKSQVEVLHSRDLAKAVIRKLRLTELGEFDSLKGGVGPIGSFLIALGVKADPAKQSAEQRALKAYYEKLTAYQIPDSKVIVIKTESYSPKVAAAIANTLSEEFVSDTRAVQSKSTGRARSWLAAQIEGLRKKVVASEIAAEKFRAKAGLLKGRDQNTTLSSQELSELNSQIILAEASRSQIQARAKAIRNMLARTGSVASSSEILNSALIQRLRERQITLEGTMAELSTTYLPNHPRIASVQRTISGLNRQIRAETLKVVSGLEQEANIATAREASLRASLNNLKTRASGSNLDEVKLRALEREATANRTLLETFLTKFSDASTRESAIAQPGLARIISKADVPATPSFPKPVPTIALATLGGLVLSLGMAFMAAVMNAVSGGANAPSQRVNVTTEQQIATNVAMHQPIQPVAAQPVVTPVAAPVGVSPVQMMPNAGPEFVQNPIHAHVPAPAPIPVTTPSLSQLPASTSLDIAMANALSTVQNNGSLFASGILPITSWANSTRQTLGAKRIAVVGLAGAELDCAATCLGLARSLMAQNIRTIIVDAAMQGSQFAAMTKTAQMPGLADLLTGYASFQDVIIKDDYSDVRIMRVGQTVGAAWPLLTSDRMETVLAALESNGTHDVVIVHGGTLPVSTAIENGAVAKCQSSLLLVSANQSPMVGNALQNLAATGMHSSQYVRISDGGGLYQTPDNFSQNNVTPINTAHVAAAAMQAPVPQAQPAAFVQNAPLFSKVAI